MLFHSGGVSSLAATLLFCGLATVVVGQTTPDVDIGQGSGATITGVHGSGTTNPSRCYWRIMDQLQSHARNPIRLTYRAIGSGSGQREFFTNPPINDFGSGDIPLGHDDWTSFNDQGITMLQLPVVLGSISFFYNIPGAPHLNLTSCTLGQIFSRRITRWDDPAILANNPNLNLPEEGMEIRVARRVDGSSSTASVTSYLNIGCSHQWGDDMVGKQLDNWHEDTMQCQGSGGMTNCLLDEVGTIGYLESGHGNSAGLQEVHLESITSGEFISSTISAENNGIAGAASLPEELPPSPTSDFSAVNFINKPGRYTWPIVAMSYIYVRQDLSNMAEESQGLLVAFLRSLYNDEYIDQCVEDFGFTRVTGAALDLALSGIQSIVENNAAADSWTFEVDTRLYEGAGINVISAKRNSFSVVHFSEVDEATAELQNTVSALETSLTEVSSRIASMEGASPMAASETTTVQAQELSTGENGGGEPQGYQVYNRALMEMQQEIAENAMRANIALAFGAVSIVLWILLVVGLALRRIIGA